MLTDMLVNPDSTKTDNVLLAANELEFARQGETCIVNITVEDCTNAAKILRALVIERDNLKSKLTKDL